MGSWFSRGERQIPANRDYAAYEADLGEIQAFLTRVNRADDDNARQFAESEGYLETLQIKLTQLERMQLFIEKAKRGLNPSPKSLVDTLGEVRVQCRQAIDLLTQRRQQMQREQQQQASNDQQHHQPADNGAINGVVSDIVEDYAAADAPVPSNYAEDSNRSPSPTSLVRVHDPQQQPVRPTDVIPTISSWAEERDYQQQLPAGARTKWEFNRKDDQYMLSVRDVYMKIKRRESHLHRMAAKYRELDRTLEITFTGERGIDRGALCREFFSFTFDRFISRKFKECGMFVGERGHLLPSDLTVDLVEAYNTVGMMIAHAARNRCRGFPGLSPAIVHYLVHNQGRGPAFIEESGAPVTFDDVDNSELRDLLIKIDSREVLNDDENTSLWEWLDKSDCRYVLGPQARDLVVQHLLIYYVFTKRIRQIEAIADGMKILNFDLFLSKNASDENIAFAFPSADDTRITPEMFLATVIERDTRNGQAWDFFKMFLNELDSGRAESSIGELIQFLSGSPYLPEEIVIAYSGNNAVLPVAQACYNELQLPTGHDSYDQFRDSMLLGLAEARERFDLY